MVWEFFCLFFSCVIQLRDRFLSNKYTSQQHKNFASPILHKKFEEPYKILKEQKLIQNKTVNKNTPSNRAVLKHSYFLFFWKKENYNIS
jgi:hypothetical protein